MNDDIEGYCSTCKQPRVWHECKVCEGSGIEADFSVQFDDDQTPRYDDGIVECSICNGDGGEWRCPTCNSGGRAARMMAEESGVQW